MAFASPNLGEEGSFQGKLKKKREDFMTVARVTELSATSDQSFEDAVNLAVKRATSTLDVTKGAG